MIRITLDNYSNYTHFATRVQFVPVEDWRTGLFIAVASLSDSAQDTEKADAILANPLFRVLENDEWEALNTPPAREEIGESETGDPLADAAQAADKAAKAKAAKDAKNAKSAAPSTPAATDTQTQSSDGPPAPPAGA